MTAFLARPALAVVQVTGDDRVTYLDDVTTQRLAGLAAGDVRGTLHLDPQGSVLAVMDVVVWEDHLTLVVPEDLVGHVLEVLGGRTFLLDANFERTPDEVVSVRSLDRDALPTVLEEMPPPGTAVRRDDLTVVGREDGVDLIGAPDDLDALVDDLRADGVRGGDAADLDDWRIRAGIPRWGREIVSGQLPEELGLLPSHVHLDKGCYPGQEAVARMWMLGRPRRRLAVLTIDGDAAPGWEAGEGRQKVRLTSLTSDGEVGLGFVPPDTADGAEFSEAGVTATVDRVIGDTLDVPGHDPQVTRRRDRRGAGASA